MENYENGRYLPVLYTIPKWRLIRYKVSAQGRNLKTYYVPWIGKWIIPSRMNYEFSKAELQYTLQDYYDRWILNITVPSDRPRCIYCGKELKFKELCSGYYRTCGSKECEYKRKSEKSINYTHSHLEDISQRVKEIWARDGQKDKMSSIIKEAKNRPESIKKTSDYMRSRWENNREEMQEINRRNSLNITYRINLSKSQSERYRKERLKNNYLAKIVAKYVPLPENPLESEKLRKRKGSSWRGITSSIYSEYERKTIYFDSDWERLFYFYMINFKSDEIEVIYRRNTIRIPYRINNEDILHNYTPDFIIKYKDGREEVIEIKPEYRLEDDIVKLKISEISDICYLTGVEFKLVTDKEIGDMRLKLKDNNIDYTLDII